MATVRLRALVSVVLALTIPAVLMAVAAGWELVAFGTPTQMPRLAGDFSATPTGWVPVAFGKAQLSVPDSWWVLYNSPPCPTGSPPGEVFVDPPPGVFHCPAGTAPGPGTTVRFGPPTSPHNTVLGHPEVINGIFVYPYPTGPRSSYLVPSLGVEITVDGPLGQRVLHTLTFSPRSVVLAAGTAPPVASSWHSVTFAGLQFSVPADWPVTSTSTWNVCGPVQVALPESVTLDTDKTFQALPCPAPMPFPVRPSDGVRVDAGAPGPTGPFSKAGSCLNFGGLGVCPSRTPDYSILFLKGTVPGHSKPVYVSIGLAGNGMVARTILYSLRAVSQSAALGSLSGTFVAVGGPPGLPPRPLPGKVTAKNSAGHRFTVTVGKRGKFVLSLPAGVYQLTGRSPMVMVNGVEATCVLAQPVRVRAKKETRGVQVVCPLK